ncbi:arsenate reductase [Ketogulonicigenium robustum]|uniref:Arsenate reductase n=1 Tax=Ketogulonicigenium robustum TaxID=92947 RepID=A0A1W6P0N9_9RHOB|nr:low molecular weight phosphatase family protein [Ketogulonicigenium robustum]ARO15004.1 arsenate reductase [Ketogulonicigenium robustum]
MSATAPLPGSVLFCCDQNSVRSPMAEGIMKKFYGRDTYVQSAGVRSDLEIDGFAIAVCAEIGVELSRHRVRSFDEMQDWGDDISAFDLVVALSSASEARVLELSQYFHMNVAYWPIPDPTSSGESRDARLQAYRDTRDAIIRHLTDRWGPPNAATSLAQA